MPDPDPVFTTVLDSPLGPLRAFARAGRLTGLYFEGRPHAEREVDRAVASGDAAPFPTLRAQLAEYLDGARERFSVPLAFDRGTPFQREVWAALQTLGYGETVGYAALAARIGRPRSARAVGRANALNPLSIVVPCHRVVGADGALVGYAGGVENKRRLLALERS